jgi:hypothetical protein
MIKNILDTLKTELHARYASQPSNQIRNEQGGRLTPIRSEVTSVQTAPPAPPPAPPPVPPVPLVAPVLSALRRMLLLRCE